MRKHSKAFANTKMNQVSELFDDKIKAAIIKMLQKAIDILLKQIFKM